MGGLPGRTKRLRGRTKNHPKSPEPMPCHFGRPVFQTFCKRIKSQFQISRADALALWSAGCEQVWANLYCERNKNQFQIGRADALARWAAFDPVWATTWHFARPVSSRFGPKLFANGKKPSSPSAEPMQFGQPVLNQFVPKPGTNGRTNSSKSLQPMPGDTKRWSRNGLRLGVFVPDPLATVGGPRFA